MRSFLFVPGDSVRKFESDKKTAADALILDLEDSIAPEGKIAARGITRQMLDERNSAQKMYIRVNALDTDMTLIDLAAVMPGRPDGIVLPKCAGAADVNTLSLYLDAFEAAFGIAPGTTHIVTVATETARAVLAQNRQSMAWWSVAPWRRVERPRGTATVTGGWRGRYRRCMPRLRERSAPCGPPRPPLPDPLGRRRPGSQPLRGPVGRSPPRDG